MLEIHTDLGHLIGQLPLGPASGPVGGESSQTNSTQSASIAIRQWSLRGFARTSLDMH